MPITMPVDMKQLCATLGIKGPRFPKDYSGEYKNVELRDMMGNTLMTTNVRIMPADNSRTRVLLSCPTCGEYMPSSQIYRHIDKKLCNGYS